MTRLRLRDARGHMPLLCQKQKTRERGNKREKEELEKSLPEGKAMVSRE